LLHSTTALQKSSSSFSQPPPRGPRAAAAAPAAPPQGDFVSQVLRLSRTRRLRSWSRPSPPEVDSSGYHSALRHARRPWGLKREGGLSAAAVCLRGPGGRPPPPPHFLPPAFGGPGYGGPGPGLHYGPPLELLKPKRGRRSWPPKGTARTPAAPRAAARPIPGALSSRCTCARTQARNLTAAIATPAVAVPSV
jgi:hypothetical protein